MEGPKTSPSKFIPCQELQHGGLAGRFLLGNPKLIGALARIKSYLDYGVFQPIQIASIIALRECGEATKKICATYQDGAMSWSTV